MFKLVSLRRLYPHFAVYMCSYMHKCVCLSAVFRCCVPYFIDAEALHQTQTCPLPRLAGPASLRDLLFLPPEHWDWRMMLSLAFSCGSWVSELTFLILCSEHCSEWWILPAPESLLLIVVFNILSSKDKGSCISLGYLWTPSSYLSLPVLVLWAQTSVFSLVLF